MANYFKRFLERMQSIDEKLNGPLDVNLQGGDIQIGAVEIKDATSDNRASIDTDGRLAVNGTRTGHQSLDEGTLALTNAWQQPPIAGHEHILIQNREPVDGTGRWIEFSLLNTGTGAIRLYPGDTIALDNIIVQNGQFSVRGEAGGELYSLILWG